MSQKGAKRARKAAKRAKRIAGRDRSGGDFGVSEDPEGTAQERAARNRFKMMRDKVAKMWRDFDAIEKGEVEEGPLFKAAEEAQSDMLAYGRKWGFVS